MAITTVQPTRQVAQNVQTPYVGQHVRVEGTGRWLGKSCSAIVADIRESDDTVKVRYCDGGFKRFNRAQFTAIATEQYAVSEKWHVGQHTYITGIGRYWNGEHYGVTIVDVRDKDDTIKVRYTDGGFKRFNRDDFEAVVTDAQNGPEGPEDEWKAHQEGRVSFGGPSSGSELDKLHEQIMEATRKSDFEMASKLKEAYETAASKQAELKALYLKLTEAVARGDYLTAHNVQQQIILVSGNTTVLPVASPDPTISQLQEALSKSVNVALGGGIAGASAMFLQVTSLMWLRTTMNYQYRHGLSMLTSMRILYSQGGILRFYQGIGPALLQGPTLRFADTACNAGVLAFFEGTDARNWPIPVKTLFASSMVAVLRITLVPVDTLKTIMQVDGKKGLPTLVARWRVGGMPVFFRGAMAWSAASFVSHYPWFAVFNVLNSRVPNYEEKPKQLLRNAGIGFAASVVSDTVSNSLRVVKTMRQTSDSSKSYLGIARKVVEKDGFVSLFGRGLGTRILANGCSGIMFSVLYKMFEEQLVKR